MYNTDQVLTPLSLLGGGTAGRIAWWAAFWGLALNNTFIMGLHSVAGSVALNTISGGAVCTQVFAVVITIFMFGGSLVRDMRHMSILGWIASTTMFMAIFLAMICGSSISSGLKIRVKLTTTCLVSGVQDHPPGYTGGPITIRAWAPPGTTFVQGFSAILNITYTYVGQIMIPSFISDMKHPEDFPKALYLCSALEIILFCFGGAIIYWQVGEEYMTSPAYGSLLPKYSKAIAGFVLPTIISEC